MSRKANTKFCVEPDTQYCQINVDSFARLKESTRKLLCLVEELQVKTRSSSKHCIEDSTAFTEVVKKLPENNFGREPSATNILGSAAMKTLESQARRIEEINIKESEEDCSVYKRLTRRCNCLNRKEFNDFMIHFNEDTKHFTNTQGEVIKNIRIIKKFLNMGGIYAKNALSFLIEGLTMCPHNERVEIIHACSYADICDIFEDNSIVRTLILWPHRHECVGDKTTQLLAAHFLHSVVYIEEGRRYLSLSSKITIDIKYVVKKLARSLDLEVKQLLNTTLELLNPSLTRQLNVTYYCKAEEGMGYRTMHALIRYRSHLTQDEIVTHLELLNNLSQQECGKMELRQHFPHLLSLSKRLLVEYDTGEINLLVISLLSNIIATIPAHSKEQKQIQKITTDTSTETVRMTNKISQVPSRRHIFRRNEHSKSELVKQKDDETARHKRTKKLLEASRRSFDAHHLVCIQVPREKSQRKF